MWRREYPVVWASWVCPVQLLPELRSHFRGGCRAVRRVCFRAEFGPAAGLPELLQSALGQTPNEWCNEMARSGTPLAACARLLLCGWDLTFIWWVAKFKFD